MQIWTPFRSHSARGFSHSSSLSLPIYHSKFITISSCINNISSTNHISHVAPQIATGVITIAVEQCVGTIYVFFNTNWRMSRDFWACAWVHDEWLNDGKLPFRAKLGPGIGGQFYCEHHICLLCFHSSILSCGFDFNLLPLSCLPKYNSPNVYCG